MTRRLIPGRWLVQSKSSTQKGLESFRDLVDLVQDRVEGFRWEPWLVRRSSEAFLGGCLCAGNTCRCRWISRSISSLSIFSLYIWRRCLPARKRTPRSQLEDNNVKNLCAPNRTCVHQLPRSVRAKAAAATVLWDEWRERWKRRGECLPPSVFSGENPPAIGPAGHTWAKVATRETEEKHFEMVESIPSLDGKVMIVREGLKKSRSAMNALQGRIAGLEKKTVELQRCVRQGARNQSGNSNTLPAEHPVVG